MQTLPELGRAPRRSALSAAGVAASLAPSRRDSTASMLPLNVSLGSATKSGPSSCTNQIVINACIACRKSRLQVPIGDCVLYIQYDQCHSEGTPAHLRELALKEILVCQGDYRGWGEPVLWSACDEHPQQPCHAVSRRVHGGAGAERQPRQDPERPGKPSSDCTVCPMLLLVVQPD